MGTLWAITLVCTATCVFVAVAWVPWVLLIPALAVPFAVRGYVIRGDTLVIERPLWSTRLPLRGLQSVRHEPAIMSTGVRTFGIGGLFSYTGRYWNGALGHYRALVNDPRLAVVLVFADGAVVVSPARPRAFVRRLRRRAAAMVASNRPRR